jgi:hypothetical protein
VTPSPEKESREPGPGLSRGEAMRYKVLVPSATGSRIQASTVYPRRDDALMAVTIRGMSARVQRPVVVSVAALLLSLATGHRAYADGGIRSPQAAPVRRSAEEIILVDNPDPTITAIIQLRPVGPSQPFAWVAAVPGKPMVGVSSNAVFLRLDAATAPEYWVEVAVEGVCMHPDDPDAALDASGPGLGSLESQVADGTVSANVPDPSANSGQPAAAGSGANGLPSAHHAAAPVVVIDHGSVGPYDYVNVQVDPTGSDPTKVATDWFTMHGYYLASLDPQVLRRSLRDGLHLLAFKLTHATDVGAIRPVVLTYESKLPVIPLALTAAGAQGIHVWVIGPSQAVPENHRALVINDAMFDWPTGRTYAAGTLPSGGAGLTDPNNATKPSNYDAIVSAAVREAGGQGFVTELGAPATRYRDKVWSSLDDQTFATISSQRYADGIDAILTASGDYRGWDGWRDAIEGATTLPAGVTIDEFGRDPDSYRGAAKVDTARFLQLLDKKVTRPVADTAAMLYKGPYLTRLYSTMGPGEMTVDPAFNYNSDLALVSDVHIARQFVRCSPAVRQRDAPWRMELPQGGALTGRGGGAWPVAVGSMPANLKIVQLSTTGSGTVVKDNSDDIGTALFKMAGTTGSGTARPYPPQNGLTIGAAQTVPSRGPAESTETSPKPAAGNKCSLSNVGRDPGSEVAAWWAQAAVMLALRRRRSRRGDRTPGALGS